MAQGIISETSEKIVKYPRAFYLLLGNTLAANIVNMTVWFALVFYAIIQSDSVLIPAFISGIYLIATSFTGFWFGSLVDNYKKKTLMILSSVVSLVAFAIGFVLYLVIPTEEFGYIESPSLWLFVVVLMVGVVAGNIRNIALPVIVTIMIPENVRDKANGLVGTVGGIGFFLVSTISALLVGHSGMYSVLIGAIIITLIAIANLMMIKVPEHEVVHHAGADPEHAAQSGIDIRGTLKAISSVPGLLSLILFTTFNNFLGGVFMALMDVYGLSLVSVEVWGLIWSFLSLAFIVGGIIITTRGLGKNPLRSMFMVMIVVWIVTSLFTVQPSIILLTAGMFIYLALIPFVEAAEHTIIQKVVNPERQGRVFGFATSIEQAASPLTAFLIGPITQFIFIPFMAEGGPGANLIGSWFGTGDDRAIALVFTLTGIIGLIVTLVAMRGNFYKSLSSRYANGD